jgi:hypothetical protein
VVAGQEQAPLRLMQDHVGRRVTRRLVDPPGAEVRLDLHALHQVSVRRHDLGDSEPLAAPRRLVLGERRGRHAALPGDFEPALEGAVGVARGLRHVLVVGVHPQLAA